VTPGTRDRDLSRGESLFWELAEELLNEARITRSTMMGYPCLRVRGAFFACVERNTGHLVLKLPAARVQELVRSGRALHFAPNGRVFREWVAIPQPNRKQWAAMLTEALGFVSY
jgi:hypothetical protein